MKRDEHTEEFLYLLRRIVEVTEELRDLQERLKAYTVETVA